MIRAPRVVLVAAVDGSSVAFSLHAATRWRERCRPTSSVADAIHQLEIAVLRNAPTIARRRPHGIECVRLVHQLFTVGWLTLADEGVAFPLVNHGDELVATTCLIGRTR